MKPNVLTHPHPYPTHPTYPTRRKGCFLILKKTKKQPKPKNQQGKQQKHEARNPTQPHPNKENKNRLTHNRGETLT
jgi:hypothetical protein